MNHPSRFFRGIVLFSALIGAVAFAGPHQEKSTGTATAGTDADVGVLVVKVEPQSPAARAGIARGDIILAVDRTDVATVADVKRAIAGKEPGDNVKLTVRHGDAKRTLTAELGELDGRTYLGVYFEPASSAGVQPPLRPEQRPAPEQRPVPDQRPAPDRRTLPHILARAGAQIVRVAAGSPAEKAGLKRGDVITAADGTVLEEGDDLSAIIGARKPGDALTIELLGNLDESREVRVTLAENPQDASKAWLGIEYRMAFRIEGSTPWAGRPQILLGVRVTGVTDSSPAAKAGIARGDLLMSIDGTPVRTAKEVADALGRLEPGDTVKVGVARSLDEGETGIDVKLGEDPGDRAKAWLGVQLGGPWLVPGWPWGPGWGGGRMQEGPGERLPGGAAPGGTDA